LARIESEEHDPIVAIPAALRSWLVDDHNGIADRVLAASMADAVLGRGSRPADLH
jgi:hypothetical protein